MKQIKFKIVQFYYYSLAALSAIKGKIPSSIYKVRAKKLTYLSTKSLFDLSRAVQELDRQKVNGEIIEAGCALGGSSIIISQSKSTNRAFKIYDVFDMIPNPTANDGDDVHQRYDVIKDGDAVGINGDKYYGYTENLIKVVSDNLTQFGTAPETNNIELIKGLFEDTLHPSQQIALAHIDCDWYDPVKLCLERITPNLSVNGKLIMDDYYDWSGCRDATDDFFKDKKDKFSFESINNKLHIKKLKD